MNTAVRRIAFGTVLLALSAYGYFTLRGPHGVPALLATQREISRFEEENANIKRDNEYREQRLKKLIESASVRDLVVRKGLRMLRKNETELVIPGAAKPDPKQAPEQGFE